jgi:hypothetical protein
VIAVRLSIVLAVVAGLAMFRPTGPRAVLADDATDRDASVSEYLTDLERLGAQGGQVVVEGMRPGIADIAQQRLPDEVLVRMADGWLASMREVEAEIRDLAVPATLADAAVRIERAMHVYVRLAETLRDAASARGDARDLLIDDAVLLGQEADRLYDEALAMLTEVRP